jgi:hypothetical protein
VLLATAAYNAGPGASRWLPGTAMDNDVWVENIPFNRGAHAAGRGFPGRNSTAENRKPRDVPSLAQAIAGAALEGGSPEDPVLRRSATRDRARLIEQPDPSRGTRAPVRDIRFRSAQDRRHFLCAESGAQRKQRIEDPLVAERQQGGEHRSAVDREPALYPLDGVGRGPDRRCSRRIRADVRESRAVHDFLIWVAERERQHVIQGRDIPPRPHADDVERTPARCDRQRQQSRQ